MNANKQLNVFSTKEIGKLVGSAIVLVIVALIISWLKLLPVKTTTGIAGLLFIMLCLGCAKYRYIPIKKSIGLIDDGKFEEALAILDNYLNRKANSASNGEIVANILKASCLFYLEKFEEAIELSQAIIKDTNNEEIIFLTRNNLISSAIAILKPMKAKSEVTKLLTMDISDSSKRDALVNIGLCYMNAEFFKEAVDVWDEGINLSKSDEQKAHLLGLQSACHNRLKKYTLALEKIEETVNLKKETDLTKAILFDNEAFALANKGERLDDALQLCLDGFALNVKAAEPHLHMSLGEVRYARGEFDEAIKELDTAITKITSRDRNSHQKACLILGKIYQAQGKNAEAEEAFNKAIAIDPEKTIAQQAQQIMAKPELNTAFYKVEDLEKMGLKPK